MPEFNIKKLSPKQFPAWLGEIPDPPKQLYLAGTFPETAGLKFLTVVGSRRASVYGREVCERLIGGLAGYPVCVISGLALGIDALAHQTALAAGLPTVAVPGSGLHSQVLYPASNRLLAQRILKAGGALLSELLPDQPAAKWTFPSRNRIMAGLSGLTLVIEAGERSGTLITARLALEYNREVAAVPGSILTSASAGANRLIKDGAYPVTESEDLLHILDIKPREFADNLEENSSGLDLTEAERLVLDCLNEPLDKDQLTIRTQLNFGELQVALTGLELKGRIRDVDGRLIRV